MTKLSFRCCPLRLQDLTLVIFNTRMHRPVAIMGLETPKSVCPERGRKYQEKSDLRSRRAI